MVRCHCSVLMSPYIDEGSTMQVDLGKGTAHPNHQANRLAYAQRIIAFMDEHIPRAKAANMAILDHAAWNRIAKLAGEKAMPSEATISMIIGMVHGRQLAVEAIQNSLGNPEARLLSRLTPAPDPDADKI